MDVIKRNIYIRRKQLFVSKVFNYVSISFTDTKMYINFKMLYFNLKVLNLVFVRSYTILCFCSLNKII